MSGNAAVPEPPTEPGLGARELEAAHEIAQAFLAATQPIEVYRLALARLTPMVRADFAAVFLREETNTDLLRPVCLHGWPQASARYIGQMRIRVGLGPTGRAVARNEPVEIADIFSAENLEDWQAPARELGFASMTTLPLATQTSVNGAVSFYYAEPHEFTDDERRLLRLISEQLAATTTRARVLDELRIENERLRRDGEHFAAAIRDAEVEAKQHDRLLASVARELLDSQSQQEPTHGPCSGVTGHASASRLLSDLIDLLELRLGRAETRAAAEDAVRLAHLAADGVGQAPMGVRFDIDVGDTIVPVTTDGRRVVRIIGTMLADAYRRTVRGEITLTVAVSQDERGQWVDWTVTSRGMALDAGGLSGRGETMGTAGAEDLQTTLAATTAEALGGEVTGSSEIGNGWWQRLRLPVRREDPSAGRALG